MSSIQTPAAANGSRGLYRTAGKRLLDLLVAGSALVALSPGLALVALAIRLDSPGPVLFRQHRAGFAGRPFTLFKLRTMSDRPRRVSEEIPPDHAEVTRVGRILRRFKIDELPQLTNVLRGEMSLVGPRPALPEQVAEYDRETRRRLETRPGLTGLAQIRGGIHLPWPERWVHDIEYVRRITFLGDLKILVRTVAVVVLGESRFVQRPDDGKAR